MGKKANFAAYTTNDKVRFTMRKKLLILAACLSATALTAQNTNRTDSVRTQKMDEVVVTRRRQLVRNDIDKLTYDVQHDETAKTKSTLEILKQIPFVSVDGQENIKVQGSSSFKVYKNGHPDPGFSGQNLKEILKAIPASTIKKIEVITDPGARYDAEGTTAILNIVMTNDTRLQGVSGNVNLSANTWGSMGAGAYLTTKTGKLTTTVSYNEYYQSAKQSEGGSEAAYHYIESGERSFASQNSSTKYNIHIGDISASYEIDSLNLLSASASGFGYAMDNNANGTHERRDKDGSLIYQYDRRSYTPEYAYLNFGGRLDYQHKTHLDGEVLTLSYMLAATRRHNTSREEYSNAVNMPVSYTGYDLNSREHFSEHTFQVDYIRPFGKHHKLESGLKYILRHNNSLTFINYTGTATDVDTHFKHGTQVAATYLSYLVTAGKWSARTGLRYEYSYMKGEYPDGSNNSFHARLNDWVPSMSLQYKMTDTQSMKISYSTSINRPGITYLNPAVISSPNTRQYGNASLGSSRNQKLQISYMLNARKLTMNLTPYYDFTNNGITDIRYVEGRTIVSTYGNVQKRREAGLLTYTRWQPFRGTTLSLNASAKYARIAVPAPEVENKGWSGSVFLDYGQKLPWKLHFDTSLALQCGRPIHGPYAYEARWHNYRFTINRSFLNDRLSVAVYANMPFTTREKYRYRTVHGDYTGYNLSWDKTRFFGIRASWSFGKLKASVKKTERSILNDDLVGGVKK